MKIDYSLFLPSENKTYVPSPGLIRDGISEQNINQILADNSQGKTFLLNLLSFALYVDVTHRSKLDDRVIARISKYENTAEYKLCYNIEITLEDGRLLQLTKDIEGKRKASVDGESYGAQNLSSLLEVVYDVPQDPLTRILKVLSDVGQWNDNLSKSVTSSGIQLSRAVNKLKESRDENLIEKYAQEIKNTDELLVNLNKESKDLRKQIKEIESLESARLLLMSYTEFKRAQLEFASAQKTLNNTKKPTKTVKKNTILITTKRQENAEHLMSISAEKRKIQTALEKLVEHTDVNLLSKRFTRLENNWELSSLEDGSWIEGFSYFKKSINDIVTDLLNTADNILDAPEFANLKALDNIKNILEKTLENAGLNKIFQEKLGLNLDEILDKISDVLEGLTILETVKVVKINIDNVPEEISKLGREIHNSVKIITAELAKGDSSDDGSYDLANTSFILAQRKLKSNKETLKKMKAELMSMPHFEDCYNEELLKGAMEVLTRKYKNADKNSLNIRESDINNRKIRDAFQSLNTYKAKFNEEDAKSNIKYDSSSRKKLAEYSSWMKNLGRNLNAFSAPIKQYENGQSIKIEHPMDEQFIDITGKMIAESLNNFILRADGERKEIFSFDISSRKFLCSDNTSVLSSEVSTGLTSGTYLAQKIKLTTKSNLFFFFDEIGDVSNKTLEIVNDAIKEKIAEGKSVTAIYTSVDNTVAALKIRHLI